MEGVRHNRSKVSSSPMGLEQGGDICFSTCALYVSCCAHRVQNPEKSDRPVDPMNVAGSRGLEHSGLAAKQEIWTDKKNLCTARSPTLFDQSIFHILNPGRIIILRDHESNEGVYNRCTSVQKQETPDEDVRVDS